jgi:hypothetical protein
MRQHDLSARSGYAGRAMLLRPTLHQSRRQQIAYLAAALVLIVVLSLVTALIFHRNARPLRGINAIERVIAFDNPKPFVLRVLGTAFVDGLYAATPDIIKRRLLSEDSPIGSVAARIARNGDLFDKRLAIHWF